MQKGNRIQDPAKQVKPILRMNSQRLSARKMKAPAICMAHLAPAMEHDSSIFFAS